MYCVSNSLQNQLVNAVYGKNGRKFWWTQNILMEHFSQMIISVLFNDTTKYKDYIHYRLQVKKWAWGIGGVILTREIRSTQRKTWPNAALSTTNPTWTGLILHLGLHDERPATSRLGLGTRWWSALSYNSAAPWPPEPWTRYPSEGNLGGSEIRSGRHWEQKI